MMFELLVVNIFLMFVAQKNESNKPDITGQLELALAWNRADIAKKEILTPERRSEWKVRKQST